MNTRLSLTRVHQFLNRGVPVVPLMALLLLPAVTFGLASTPAEAEMPARPLAEAYAVRQSLAIDPTLGWHTFLGGIGEDGGYAIAVDGNQNVYVAGNSQATWGSPMRAHSGKGDAFAARLDAGGRLMWNTFLGGNGEDVGYAIAVDESGNVYIAGWSYESWGTPIRAHSGNGDAFAAKLDARGQLIWNTFLGETGEDSGFAIAVDDGGNVYVAGGSGATWGSPVRAYSGDWDAFVAKLDPAGRLTWNTFLGGEMYEYAQALTIDGRGQVYVAGCSWTAWGTPVRAYSGGIDAFAAKLDSGGRLIWNTFLGGDGHDYGEAVAIDASGNVYVAGGSMMFWGSPIRGYGGGRTDAFAAKLNADGRLAWNTFAGGYWDDEGQALAVDESGNVYLSGYSWTTWGTPVSAHSEQGDAFAAKLDRGGGLIWNTFVGGSAYDYGEAIAVDGKGNVYLAGRATTTWGSPIRACSGDDAFVVKIPPGGAVVAANRQ